jgi:hypothetical protein
MDLEGAVEEIMDIIMVKTAEDKLPRWLTEEDEFLICKKRKVCYRREKIEAGDYVGACLMEEEEYILWWDQCNWSQEEQIMDEKMREDEDAGFGEEE